MPPDRDYGRLAKTICLLDSPIAGERAAALEAIRRQLDTLGLRWADVAPQFSALDSEAGAGTHQSRRATTADRSLSRICHWNDCSQNILRGSPFCETHVANIIREPLNNFATFLKNLPGSVNAETTGNALYHAVHDAVHIGMFNPYVGHDLMRAASASRDGTGVGATVAKLATAIGVAEQGEFMMHLKRQLVLPERRSARREVAPQG